MSKKAEYVPLIIIVIGILLIIYTYLLPLSEKCALMPSLPECNVKEEAKILDIVPGLLQEQAEAARYSLPDVSLFRMATVDVSTVLENTKVSKTWFYSNSAESDFEAQENAREAKLFIFVNSAKGKLKVYVNNERVGTIEGEGLKQVLLDIDNLGEINTIKIVPTTPLFPFMANEYEIGKIVLKENYIVTNNRVSEPFAITENQKDIAAITFGLRTRCFTEENLSVFVNNVKIMEDKVCKGVMKDVTDVIFSANMSGDIVFASEGNYDIHDIKLDIRMKTRTWPTYYFYIEKPEKPLLMRLEFNQTGTKKLTAYVNGNALSVDTTKSEWQTAINKYLKEYGTNSILLIPEQSVIISRLEVK